MDKNPKLSDFCVLSTIFYSGSWFCKIYLWDFNISFQIIDGNVENIGSVISQWSN